MREDGLKTVYLMSANYQAGKDMLAGFLRYYKRGKNPGKIVGRIMYKLGNRDYQAHIAKIRAAKPEALFVFAPGGQDDCRPRLGQRMSNAFTDPSTRAGNHGDTAI